MSTWDLHHVEHTWSEGMQEQLLCCPMSWLNKTDLVDPSSPQAIDSVRRSTRWPAAHAQQRRLPIDQILCGVL